MMKKSRRVIPGFGISLGITVTILSIVVLIPLASLAIYSAKLGFGEFLAVITRPRVLSGFWVSFITAFVAALVNAVMGTVVAWVLVRYCALWTALLSFRLRFPRRLRAFRSRR